MRRVGGVLAALLLLAGVAFAVFHDRIGSGGTTAVRGLIGSEKAEFFADPAVVRELKAKGFRVDVQTTGSWSMTSTSLDGYDFAFPSSLPPAEEIRSARHISTEPVRPFYSPLVVIAHAPVAEVLRDNGLAVKSESGLWTFRMDAYLAAVRADRTWQSLKGSAGHAELSGALYVTTTDPATSSSGALHLAAVSYLANGGRVVSDDAGVARTAPLVRQLTAMQGDQKTSSDGPFKDFLSGVGNPLVLVYESQVASLAAQGRSTGDLVVLYPDTTVSSDHTAVALTPEGDRLARLLRDDEKLRALEAKFGFRPQGDAAAFAAALAGRPGAAFAPDLSAAGVRQAPVPAVAVLSRLVDAAKGR
ncbi:hypothetical protein [Kitasatospora atroaurantiaca]|uniref:Extracellular solute-binding protein n=1 Tax=Kitasatospora atroaurantiaca TaxID=285545 RepID=A0A561ELL8_9ACTN|nr:hypothetical protein [Kitasatospora atroaurantiaca]TWE16517.1 hypothetical protein FB465_1500 [Kitasatospora atroaurantiaca]